MEKARTLNVQVVLVLIAGLLAAAAVWAGMALAGGGSGGNGVDSNPAAPARGDAGLVQDSNENREGDRDCPFKDGRGDSTGFDTSTL